MKRGVKAGLFLISMAAFFPAFAQDGVESTTAHVLSATSLSIGPRDRS